MSFRSSLPLVRLLPRLHASPSSSQINKTSGDQLLPLFSPISSVGARCQSSGAATSSKAKTAEDDKEAKIVEINKDVLAARVASVMAHSPAQSKDWINAIILQISEALKNNERVALYGFGRFEKKERSFPLPKQFFGQDKEESGRKKREGEEGGNSKVQMLFPTFRASAKLKTYLNEENASPVAPAPKKPKAIKEKEEEKKVETKSTTSKAKSSGSEKS